MTPALGGSITCFLLIFFWYLVDAICQIITNMVVVHFCQGGRSHPMRIGSSNEAASTQEASDNLWGRPQPVRLASINLSWLYVDCQSCQSLAMYRWSRGPAVYISLHCSLQSADYHKRYQARCHLSLLCHKLLTLQRGGLGTTSHCPLTVGRNRKENL